MSLTLLALVSIPALCMQAPSTAPTQAAPLPKAEDVLAKLEAAIGDAAARAKVKNVVVTGTFSMEIFEGPGKHEELYTGSRAKWTTEVPQIGTMTQGSTDTYSWSAEVMGITIKEGDDRDSVQRQYAVLRRAPWNTMFASATVKKRTQIEGRDVFELDMAPKKGAHDTWFVDAGTYALVALESRMPDPQGGEFPLRYEFSDWRKVDGVAYPFARKMKVGTYVVDYKIERIEHPEKLDEARLAPPPEVVAAFQDPKRRATVAPEKPGECTRTKIEAQPVASIRVKCKTKDIATTLASILPEVMTHLTSIGASMTGPPFSRYHSIDGDTVDLEAGLPVKKPIQDSGRIKASELPAGEVAVTWHFGQYEDLPKSYAVLEAWMKSQSLESGGGMWEVYWTDPGIEPDPKKWRTQLLWPIKKK